MPPNFFTRDSHILAYVSNSLNFDGSIVHSRSSFYDPIPPEGSTAFRFPRSMQTAPVLKSRYLLRRSDEAILLNPTVESIMPELGLW